MKKKYNNNNLINKYFKCKVNNLGIVTPFIVQLTYLDDFDSNISINERGYPFSEMIYKIISISKISHTLSKGRVMNYKIVSCGGNRTGWIGLGTYANNKFFSTISLSKYKTTDNIYLIKSNYKININEYFKYKGCKIKFVHRIRDKFKLMKMVTSVHSVSGKNKFNLISFCSGNTNVLIKLLLNSLASFK